MLSQHKVKSSPIIHASIVGNADRSCGWTTADMASVYDVSTTTVAQLKTRVVEAGFEAALYGTPVTNAHRRNITGDEAAHVMALCCRQAPAGQARGT
jgi:hypothetical protein